MLTKSDLLTRIKRLGYKIESLDANGKNQTRNYHFILSKDGVKYFGKINKDGSNRNNVSNDYMTGTLLSKLNQVRLKVISPLQKYSLSDDSNLCIYNFIPFSTITSESKKFKDFNITEIDLPNVLNLIVETLRDLQKIQLISESDLIILKDAPDQIINIINTLDLSTYRGFECIKALSKLLPKIKDKRFATGDFQFQNMSWDSKNKQLYLFDFELSGQHWYLYDFSHLFFVTWTVQDKREVSLSLLNLYLSKLDSTKKILHFSVYFKYNLLTIALGYSKAFAKSNERSNSKRCNQIIDWVLDSLVEDINKSI